MESNTPPASNPRRRWMRWVILSFNNQHHPVPNNNSAPAAKPLPYDQPTSIPLLAVPPPWPALVIPDNAPQLIKDHAARFTWMHAQLEACRKAYEDYARDVSRMDLKTSTMRLNELWKMVNKVDGIKDHILDQARARQLNLSPDVILEISQRINEFRDTNTRFHLDQALRFGLWREAGLYFYYRYGEWDRAVYYWRKAGLAGSLALADAYATRLDRGFWKHIGDPVATYAEDSLEGLTGMNF